MELLGVRVIAVSGCFAKIDMKNRFWVPQGFKPESLEICEFVSSNRIFPEVVSVMAFDWLYQMACRDGVSRVRFRPSNIIRQPGGRSRVWAEVNKSDSSMRFRP